MKMKFSMKFKLLFCTIAPVLLLVIILALISKNEIEISMEDKSQDGLQALCYAVRAGFDHVNDAPYEVVDGKLMKGDLNLTDDTELVDAFTKGVDAKCTIFIGDTRYATSIINADGTRPIGTTASAEVTAKVLGGQEFFAEGLQIAGSSWYAYYTPLYQEGSNEIIGMVFAGEPAADVENAISSATSKVISVSVIGLIIMVALMLTLAFSISNAIIKVSKVISALSGGDLTVEIEDKLMKRADEVGAMSRDVETYIESLRGIIGNIQNASKSVLDSGDELEQMAHQTSQTADDIAAAIDDISKGAVNQAEDVESASSSVGEMGFIIEQIVANVERLNQTSATMQAEGNESAQIMAQLAEATNRTVDGITKVAENVSATDASVQEITEAVNLITGIASQTNLLSLNASIEAARAGEAGKGFAVVASEIQHLSEESNDSAKRIEEIVKTLSLNSRASLTVMKEVNEQLQDTQNKLNATMTKFQAVNSGIETSRTDTFAINNQAQDCDTARANIIDVVSNLSAISEENAASTEETTASMQELNATMNLLAESARQLKEMAVSLDENTQFFQM